VFTVDPPLACPGQIVQVQWRVQGKATLRAERGSADWDEEEVPSSGRRFVAPAVTTTFKITASDVNPAAGPSFGVKTVEIPKLFDERRVVASCDPAIGKCRGEFVLDNAAGALRVRRLSAPLVIQRGHAQAAEVCVTHDGVPGTCVSAGQAIDVDVPANGTWTLEAALAAGMPVTPPPALSIHLDFGCQ
jgi:hypothetical protein